MSNDLCKVSPNQEITRNGTGSSSVGGSDLYFSVISAMLLLGTTLLYSSLVASQAENITCSDGTKCETQNDVILGYQNDIEHFTTKDASSCCGACNKNSECVAWTFSSSNSCYLHRSDKPVTQKKDHVSGLRSGPPPPPPPPPGPPPQPTAAAACASFNLSTKVELMHGFGRIDGYSRNR